MAGNVLLSLDIDWRLGRSGLGLLSYTDAVI